MRDFDCRSTWLTVFLAWAIMFKAIVIIISNISGIRYYWRRELFSGAVVFALICSSLVIALEVFYYRFVSDRDLRIRYILDAAGMWLVFSTFNFILVFAYKAGAAHFNFHFRYYSLPIHGLYLIMAFVGW